MNQTYNLLNFNYRIFGYFIILAHSLILKMLNSEIEFILCQMRLFKYRCLLLFKQIWILVSHSQIVIDVVIHWLNNPFLDVFQDCINERCANFFHSLLDPCFIMQEVPFSSQNAKVYCKIIIVAINYRQKTRFYLLSDV